MKKFILTLLAFALIASVFAVTCGETIVTSVDLTEDLNCSGDGLIIGANDVILNCDGHSINGDGSGIGVLMKYYSELAISSCNINNFDIGIQQGQSSGSDGSSVSYNEITNCNTGILVKNSATSVIINNDISSSSIYGIHVDSSNNNQFYGNTIEDSQGVGFYVENSDNNYFYDNYLDNPANAFDNGDNNWNIPEKSKKNIVNGPNTGGNYWGDFGSESDGCLDDDYDGFCDDSVSVSGGSNVDSLPLKEDWVPNPTLPAPVDDGLGGGAGGGGGGGGSGGGGSGGVSSTASSSNESSSEPVVDGEESSDETENFLDETISFNEKEEITKNDVIFYIIIIVIVAVVFIGYMLSKSRSR